MDRHADLKRLRRETREEASRIVMPIAIPAVFLLLCTVFFYFRPLSGLLPVLKGNYGQISKDRTWLYCWMIGAPLTGAAIGVYRSAFKILLRMKTGMGSERQQMLPYGRKGSRAPIYR